MPASRACLRSACRTATVLLALSATLLWLTLAPTEIGASAAAASSSAVGPSVAGGASAMDGAGGSPSLRPSASATLTQCATATIPQSERSATFAGEMLAVAGSTRMEMRIDLEERAPGEALYRTVSASALGVWHVSAPGVKTFTHIQQVTNLSAPAYYRGAVRFRWLNAKGHTIKSLELRTGRCEQPTPPSSSVPGLSTPTAVGAAPG